MVEKIICIKEEVCDYQECRMDIEKGMNYYVADDKIYCSMECYELATGDVEEFEDPYDDVVRENMRAIRKDYED